MIDERDIKLRVFNYLNTDTKHNNTIDTVKWGKDIDTIEILTSCINEIDGVELIEDTDERDEI